MNYYDPSLDAPFEKRNIPLPEGLRTEDDYAQLFQHIISEFSTAINIYTRQHGYRNRQQLLSSIMIALKEMIPETNPDFIINYPSSIGDIKNLIASLMLIPTEQYPEKKFAYIHQYKSVV